MTVIEARVHRTSERNAKLAFFLTTFVVGLLSATVAASYIHPILALFVGMALGLVCGAIVWALVRIWPVIRLLWWWTPETLLGLAVVYGFTALAHHTTLAVRIAVVALIVGVPAAVPYTRRRIVALAWCFIVRHRIRTCFAQFIIANQSGTLPLILWAKPTPVGERVWVWLRTGLSLADLNARLDKIAVACWASTVTVERASDGNAAYVRLDIKRRDALTATVGSPLVGLVDPDTPAAEPTTVEVPTALDLPDMPAEPATVRIRPMPTPRTAPASKPAAAPAVAGARGEDLSDWID
ncbi:hypothetical protein Pme01_38870 [Planosporangium mesophilum]|uniref:Uncharacterized protein n=1 Tax=Planosporangium mesophilum TaxID=689768 RepID=A0A8J3X1C1_9ACTN|nr:hypothetical protein [Planosporangium mesophilum]GII24290.1 hypothetical protein Pme01_38870 [Planosporangium mesophilum]